MFKVLRTDGRNLTTDKGCISLSPFSYADGGKSKPVGPEDQKAMQALFVAAPELLAALRSIKDAWDANDSHGIAEEIQRTFPLLARFTN